MKLTKFQAKKRNKYYIVYRIYNDFDKNNYIGAHKIRFGRENDGYICSSTYVLSLVSKNKSAFHKVILGRYSTAREADRVEKKMIEKYDSFRNGYNRSKDGGHFTCYGSKKNRLMYNKKKGGKR